MGHLHRDAQVRVAVVALRRPYRDEHHLRASDGPGQVGGEGDPLGRDIAPEQLLEARLVDGRLAPPERLHLGLVHVDTGHEVARLGEAGARHEADVPGSHHCDSHAPAAPSKGARPYSTLPCSATSPSARATCKSGPGRSGSAESS